MTVHCCHGMVPCSMGLTLPVGSKQVFAAQEVRLTPTSPGGNESVVAATTLKWPLFDLGNH